MFDRILPRSFDNRFQGHVVGLWLFAPIVCMKILISLALILFQDGGVQSLSTNPLNSFVEDSSEIIIGLFEHMGVAQLLFATLCLIVMLRYRAMIPLMYSLMLLDHFAKNWISVVEPIAMTGVYGAAVAAQILLIITVFGFVLSLYRAPQSLGMERINSSHAIRP
jgi:hypothetical protein